MLFSPENAVEFIILDSMIMKTCEEHGNVPKVDHMYSISYQTCQVLDAIKDDLVICTFIRCGNLIY